SKAGIAFWGASANTMWDEDDILEKRMFQAAFAETCHAIGDMTDKALYYLYQYYSGGGYTRYYLDCYNIMGDPSIDLWTSAAESLYVDCPTTVSTGTNPANITVQKSGGAPVFGALVCLYKDGEVFETGYTNALGQLTLYPSPLTTGFIDITVTAHNHLPSVGVIEVGQQKGDLTGDGQVDIGDVLFLGNYLYRSGPAPNPPDIGDVNCDGTTDLGDVVYLVNYLYQNGPPPCS
ncbi:MAG: dockerin type I domain-containing protein, partial [Candidatus Zixiibacteriota bacterium]